MDAVNCSNKSCFSDKEIFKCDAITSDIFDILLISAIEVTTSEVIILFKEVNRVLDRNGLFILDQLNPQHLITDESFVELIGSQHSKAYEKIGSKCPDGWRKVTRKYFTYKNNFKEMEELLYFHKLENLRDIALIVGFKTCLVWNGFGKSRVHRNSSRWVFEIRA